MSCEYTISDGNSGIKVTVKWQVGFLAGSAAQNPSVMQEMQETPVWSMGGEDPLEEGMATRCSSLAWRIPRPKEPGGLQSVGLLSRTRLKQLSTIAQSGKQCATVAGITEDSFSSPGQEWPLSGPRCLLQLIVLES